MDKHEFLTVTDSSRSPEILLKRMPRSGLGKEPVALWRSLDRLLASDFSARGDSVPFRRSITNGNAIGADDAFEATAGTPVSLRVIGRTGEGDD